MNIEELITEIRKVAVEKEGRLHLQCHEARRIADERKISYTEIGKFCNEQKIKITNCELGCF